MPQPVQMPDGTLLTFPDDTPREVMLDAVRRHAERQGGATGAPPPAPAGPPLAPPQGQAGPPLAPPQGQGPAPPADIAAGLGSLEVMQPMAAPGPVGTPGGEGQGGLSVTARDLGVDLQPLSGRAGGEVSWQEGYLRSLIDEGVLLGAGDEMAAAVMATMEAPFSDRSWSEIYESALAQERGRLEAAPLSARLAGNLAGAAIPGAGVVQGTRQLATLPARIGALAGGGAAFGGLSGFLQGEGGLGPRAEEAAGSAALGAVATPALRGAQAVGGRLLGRVGATDAYNMAYDKLRQALLRSGLNPRQAERRLQDMGPEAVLADLTENTRRKFGDVIRQPGSTRDRAIEFLEGRQADQGERVLTEVRRLFGENRSFGDVLDEIVAEQKKLSTPLYEQAFQTPVDVTNELRSILNRPSFKKAAFKAQQLAGDEGRDIPQIIVRKDDGTEELVANPDLETFDWIKRALDDRIGFLLRNERGDEARILTMAKNEMLAALDEQVPVYKSARGVWEGQQKALETLKEGQRFMRGIFEDQQRALQVLPPGTKPLYRLGALREIEDKLYRSPEGADKVKALFGSPEKKRRMRALFPDQGSFEAFARRMEIEADFSRTFSEIRGSPTAARLQEAADTSADVAVSFLSGVQVRDMIGDLLRRGAFSEREMDALGDVMLRQGPEAVRTLRGLIRGLPKNTKRQAVERALGDAFGGLTIAAGPAAASGLRQAEETDLETVP